MDREDLGTHLGERLLSCLAAEGLAVLGTSLESPDAVGMADLWE
jgi:hypothetical protein